MYEIQLTQEAQGVYQEADVPLAKRLNRCFDQLRHNPYEHPNIKRLRGSLKGYWRYRVGDWRVIYRIDQEVHRVVVVLIVRRSQAYR